MDMGGITKPVSDVAKKATAGKIKSIKVKMKFDTKANPKQASKGNDGR